jgi:hypothetical protein
VAFILSDERGADVLGAFARYRAYVRREGDRFPPGALSLVNSEWYFNPEDHRSPHDAWLQMASLREVAEGSRQKTRHLTCSIELLGAYHDVRLCFDYPRVFRYQCSAVNVSRGHADWRFDEFRVSESGHLLHEIEWHSQGETARWLIEASDVTYRWEALERAT